jgi:hypothetical protein
MYSVLIDMTGRRYGRLMVLHRAPDKIERTRNRVMWWCRCDCGTEKAIVGEVLRRGDATGCGCGRARSHLIHGACVLSAERTNKKTKEYAAWANAKKRCTNPNDARYHRYGARGIRMCDRWLNSFEAFIADMGPCPPGLTLDRIDNDGPYAPGNCRWTDRVTQRRNR